MSSIIRLIAKKGAHWCIQDGKGNLYDVDDQSLLRSFIPDPVDSEHVQYHKFFIPIFTKTDSNKVLDSLQQNTFETFTIPSSERTFLVTNSGQVLSMDYRDLLNGKRGKIAYTIKPPLDGRAHGTDRNFFLITPGGIQRWGDELPESRPIQLKGDILSGSSTINYNNLSFLKNTGNNLILLWYRGNIYEASETPGLQNLETRLLANGPSGEVPSSVFYSRSLQLFISYYLKKGLVFYRPNQFTLLRWDLPIHEQHLSEDYYYSMIPEKDGFITINDAGVIWLGTDGEKRLLTRAQSFEYFLHKDLSGNIWYNEKQNDMICYLKPVTLQRIPVFRMDHYSTLCGIYQATDSIFFILNNRELWKLVLKNDKTRSVQSLFKGEASSQYNVLFVKDAHTLWLGSDRGLVEFNLSNNSTREVAALQNNYVRAITKLDENNWLVGTYDKGIYQYKNGKWLRLASADRIMPASAHAFVKDTLTSSLWVSSNSGIIRIPLDQLMRNNEGAGTNILFRHFTDFGPEISSEFNGSSNISGAKLSDTCIAFANAKGLVLFNPQRLVSYPLPVNVLIEPVKEEIYDSLKKEKSNPYQVQFDAVVPYFGNLQDLEILYRLTNSDENWRSFIPNSTISYNNLGPGKHELEFLIRYHHDPEGKEVLVNARTYYIPYRWYQKDWFVIALLVVVAAIIILLHNLRLWYILKRKRELEQQVKMKTSELQESNQNLVEVIEELSFSESSLKQSNYLKDEYYAVLTHDLRSPLKFLSFNIGQLLEQTKENENEILKKGLFAAYQCSNDVHKLIDEFVYWIRDNEHQLQVQPLPTQIGAVIADVKKIYDYGLDENKNTLVTDIPVEFPFMTDPKLLFIILRNAVDNANKYTVKGRITISASRQNGNLELAVSDTGRGMKKELIEDLMALQGNTEQLTYKKRKSLGFYIMAMLIKKLDGKYTIISVKEEGTVLRFIIPESK